MDDVFDLKEFIITILRRWKMIVILALAFCVLGGGYKAVPILLNGADSGILSDKLKTNYEQEAEAYQNQKTSLENAISTIQSEQSEAAKYNINSIFMKINPYKVNVAALDIYVKTDHKIVSDITYQIPDYAEQIVDAYSVLIQSGSMYESMIKDLNLNTEQRYLRELINIADNTYNGNERDNRIDGDIRILSIQVSSPDAKMSAQIKDYLLQCIIDNKDQMTDRLGKHTLEVINNSEYSSIKMDIYATQKNYLAQSAELTKSLNAKQDELKNLQQPDASTLQTELTGQSAFLEYGKSIIKFMLLGFFGGILLGVLLAFFIDVFNNSIQNDYEIRKMYKLQYFGRIPNENGSGK
ncbi:hypothetical protein [Caproiciproducens sp. CPB-2]|uniref:hypothetical protein n=1 Tax=Caproiciproducens sp. CPB-2 TaxID=3030017 RepID=UPI0023DA8A05|nr:hypothetical protein [Caproiciproducens sp. CPB-2]MDF1494085.1 hypothetical protein [Caproiciproducens sp. CPB-2]